MKRMLLLIAVGLLLLAPGCEKKEDDSTITGPVIKKYGSIAITGTAKAYVYVDGRSKGLIPVDDTLFITRAEVGEHEVEARKHQHDRLTTTVEVFENQTTHVVMELLSSIGTVIAISDPQGAEVFIDGLSKGTTPATLEGVRVGMREIRLVLDDYADFVDSIRVGRDSLTMVTTKLVYQIGLISIGSTPSGASITLDGEDLGVTTPAVIDSVLATTHRIGLSLADYVDTTFDVTVSVHETSQVFVEMEHEVGNIRFISNPKGADITVDGVPTGFQTNYLLTDVLTGPHTVTLSFPGYNSYSEDVVVEANKKVDVIATLQRAPTFIAVNSVPAGADIYLNDSATGLTTPDTLIFDKSGTHDVRLMHRGFFPSDNEASLDIGLSTDVFVSLVPIPYETEIYYTTNDTIWVVGPDGYDAEVFAIDYDELIVSYHRYDGNMLWSPDGEYMVYTSTNTNHVMIKHRDGTIKAELTGSRAFDFNWSSDSRYLVFGWYGGGIYKYDMVTESFEKIMDTWCYCYDHCPVFSPGDSLIAFVHNEYGTAVRLYIINSDGTNRRRVTDWFGSGHDENINLTWVSDSEIICKDNYKEGYGIRYFDLTLWNDTTKVKPETFLMGKMSLLHVSKDKTKFYYSYGRKVYQGDVGVWTSTRIIEFESTLRDFFPLPDKTGVISRNDNGVYWVAMDGNYHRVVTIQNAKRGAVTVRP